MKDPNRSSGNPRPPALIAALGLAIFLTGSFGCPAPAPSQAPEASDNREVQNRGEGKDHWWDALPRAAWSEFRRVEQSQPWYEVYEILPGVFAIYEPGQFEEIISYLIVGSERALLFDTGLGIGDMRRLAGELTDREIVVLNSHTHYDHVGGNHAFETVYGTSFDYTKEHEAGRPHEEVAEFVGEGWIWKETPEGFSAEGYRSHPFTITHRVEDGEILSLGNVELEVLLTPGHAPDTLCLLDRERRLLFTGDTFYPATLYSHLPGSSFEDYEDTAARLAGLADAVDRVLPAHNEPTLPAAELVALRNAFRAMREEGTPYVLTDGSREYDFGRFSILVSDPPPWNSSVEAITRVDSHAVDPIKKETFEMTHASGTFEVKLTPQTTEDDAPEGARLGRMSIDKRYLGDLEAGGEGEMLTAVTSTEGSAAYVAIERVKGSLNGKNGTFTLRHSGTMTRGEQSLSITVVPDSGTGELVGLAGEMKITIEDGKHFYEFDYRLIASR